MLNTAHFEDTGTDHLSGDEPVQDFSNSTSMVYYIKIFFHSCDIMNSPANNSINKAENYI